MKNLACLAFLLVFGLVACGGAVQSITPTASASLAPTSTILITPTSDATNALTSTLAITHPIPTPGQTQIALATATFLCHAEPYDYLPSPDGKWMAVSCDNDHLTAPAIQIVKLDGTKKWQLSFKGVPGIEHFEYETSPGVVIFIGHFLPHRWYKDSRYLFIAPWYSTDGPTWAIPMDGVGLYRFDTETGQLSPILEFSESAYDFAFSPNDEYYVYSDGLDEKNIHLVNIQTGEEQTISVPGSYGETGRFVWSPDSFKFVFVQSDVEKQQNSLVLFDVVLGTYTTLLETDPTELFSLRLAPVKWASDHQVILEEPYWLVGFPPPDLIFSYQQEYILDIDTKQVSPLPTPAR